jgi:hypothetical protein
MTTPYAVSVNMGSMSYNNYVNTPITGPLSTSQTPGQIPYHSKGLLAGTNPTPPQFFPLQEPLYSEMNTNARQQYLRTRVNKKDLLKQIILGKCSAPVGYHVNSTGNYYSVSTHTNYIAPVDHSLYINTLKSNAIGQSAFKVGLPNNQLTGTKNYFPSSTRSTLRRTRSGGCVAPKKKGAIQNTHLTNSIGWGSIVRQNY